MEKRDFLIQRYCSGNWPAVKGKIPFLVSGPRFKAYTTTRALTEYEWKFQQAFLDEIKEVRDDSVAALVVAELFLREGIVQALWSIDHPDCLPESERWSTSVERLASEFSHGELYSSVMEFLSGISEPGYYRTYLSEDSMQLVPVSAPPE